MPGCWRDVKVLKGQCEELINTTTNFNCSNEDICHQNKSQRSPAHKSALSESREPRDGLSRPVHVSTISPTSYHAASNMHAVGQILRTVLISNERGLLPIEQSVPSNALFWTSPRVTPQVYILQRVCFRTARSIRLGCNSCNAVNTYMFKMEA